MADACYSLTSPTGASPETLESSTNVGLHEAQVATKPASSVQQSTSLAPPPPLPPASQLQTPSSESISERLWNEAYDRLKKKDPSLVDAYEKVVSEKLEKGEIGTEGSQLDKNLVEQTNKEKRRLQMELLVNAGMQKTERERENKGGGRQCYERHSLIQRLWSAGQFRPFRKLPWHGPESALLCRYVYPPAYKASTNIQDCREPIYGDDSKS
jgi:hypothetical protein